MVSATDVLAVLARFASDTRLYELSWPDGDGANPLTVEAFTADDRLMGAGRREVLVLASQTFNPALLLRQRACLHISLPDRTRAQFSGVVSDVQLLGRHGRLARYRLRIGSWLYLLAEARNCRVWEDKSVVDIVEDVFRAYQYRGAVVQFRPESKVRRVLRVGMGMRGGVIESIDGLAFFFLYFTCADIAE